MADVTISSLPIGTPLGSAVIPFSLGGNTYSAPISGIFQNRPAFRVWNGTGQSLTSNQVMTFNANNLNNFNPDNYFSNNRFNSPLPGIYNFTVNILLNTASGGSYWGIIISLNGTTAVDFCYAAGTSQQSLNLSSLIKLNQGDYVDVRATTNGTINIDNSGSFSGYLIG